MCVPPDSMPPVPPVSGAAVDTMDRVLVASDGTEFAAFEARGNNPSGPAVVVLPDVRGLFGFYEELAVRFAERGIDAVTIDYFGRTAGVSKRNDPDFPFMDHVMQTTHEGVAADTAAAIALLRAGAPGRSVFTVGFCFGGSSSWHQAAANHRLAGAVGFYGRPTRAGLPIGSPAVVDIAGDMSCPILALMGGDDPGIPAEDVAALDEALSAARVTAEVVTYPGAPHSFFDRAEEFADACDDAWARVLAFIDVNA